MRPTKALIESTTSQLLKAIKHLQYSYKKVQNLPLYQDMDDETLETWESFAARFARVADIFIMKYVRVKIFEGDPGFNGTLRDFLNKAEKINLIDNSEQWLEIRELRNITAHEYREEDFIGLYKKLKQLCPLLLNLEEKC